MPTVVKENYLKALYSLEEHNGRISITDLSKRLAVSKPTANNMVKSLVAHGWVNYQKYKPLQLTDKGRIAAAKIIRKHRLTEMFLYEVMGFGWEEVHEIAEQMEHINSEELFNRMDEMLKYPSVDPHGSPIPDVNGNIKKQQLKALVNTPAGESVKLIALSNSSTDLLQHLNQCNIELGVRIELLKVEAFDKSCLIRVEDHPPIVISQKVAESLLVKGA